MVTQVVGCANPLLYDLLVIVVVNEFYETLEVVVDVVVAERLAERYLFIAS